MWDSQRKATGGISDRLRDDRKAVQKTTFTRWMNVFLQKRDPPLEVCDLFTDIQDGRILMALLEELSGCKLLYRFRSSSHHIFRLNNISKALAFLDDRHVKLLDIDASSVADGNPSVVLNLVWNIILHFQVKEVTGGLQRHMSSSLSSLPLSPSIGELSPPTSDNDSYSCNSLPRKARKTSKEARYYSKAINTLLQWVQRCTSKYGVDVDDFGTSWRSGLAFLALIKSINPDLVNLRENLSREPRENIQQAFMTAHHSLGVPPLLEPEDVLCSSPDEQSIITYVSMFLGHLSGANEDHSANLDLLETPNVGSPEPVSFGETPPENPDAQALLKGFEKSNEQLLWRRWSPRVSGTSSPRRAFPPPSPLDACIVNQEIRSWMEKDLDQGYRKKRADGSQVSMSSEEGIYSLSALDSDEEDAYTYILDLNKEVFQPYNQPKRLVAKVEEETAEQIQEESNHLEEFGFNGSRCPQQDGPVDEDPDPNLQSEVGFQSAGNRKFDLDKNKSGSREASNTGAEDKQRIKELEEERPKRAPNNDDPHQTDGDKSMDDAVNKITVEAACWQKDAEEEQRLSENYGNVSERRRVVGDVRRSEEGQDLRKDIRNEGTKSQENVNSDSLKVKIKERRYTADVASDAGQTSVTRVNTETGNDRKDPVKKLDLRKKTEQLEKVDHVIKPDYDINKRADCKNRKTEVRENKYSTAKDQNGGRTPRKPSDVIQDDQSQTAGCRTSQSFSSEGGLSLWSLTASCDVTLSELEMLLLLWILLYCYFILPQINL